MSQVAHRAELATAPARLAVRPGAPGEVGVPLGTRIELDASTRRPARNLLAGGTPTRILRLSEAGVHAFEELRDGPVSSPAAARLARRLGDVCMANPLPGRPATTLGVTIVVPVRDRPDDLARCLQALGAEHRVLVVDDGSLDPVAVAAICRDHGARLARRSESGGPTAARNLALGLIESELVAFVDSDCVPPAAWTSGLAGHFDDPLVGAVAPRIVPLAAHDGGTATRYGAARSPLDLGERPALVAPRMRVSYVPAAALVVRRCALGEGFDEQLRYGEDVDLLWRLVELGWRVRYEPTVQVAHREPGTWGALLRRRFLYGTSAAPLARRHPGAVAPLLLGPWPTLVVVALLARRPRYAAAAYAAGAALAVRRLRSTGLPLRMVWRSTLSGVWACFLGLGRWCGQFAWPALAWVLVRPGGLPPARRHRRAAVAGLWLVPALHEWVRRRPRLDPLRFGLGMLADEAAYGTGVWRQCLRERTWSPILPSVARNRRRG